jgi:hypothetical protein
MDAFESRKHRRKDPEPRMCQYCLKKISKRYLQRHESRCFAANLCMPNGYRVEKEKQLKYTCPCGYTSRRSRIFHHIAKHHSDAIKIESSNNPSAQHHDVKAEDEENQVILKENFSKKPA